MGHHGSAPARGADGAAFDVTPIGVHTEPGELHAAYSEAWRDLATLLRKFVKDEELPRAEVVGAAAVSEVKAAHYRGRWSLSGKAGHV
jgi:hypothetical protein